MADGGWEIGTSELVEQSWLGARGWMLEGSASAAVDSMRPEMQCW